MLKPWMIDAHIHFESQPYTLAGLNKFIAAAQANDIHTIMILEHTHRFMEWSPLYQNIVGIDQAQDDWYLKKQSISIQAYQSFILAMRQHPFPIKVLFGLEVCYFKEQESFIKKSVAEFPYDFCVGSIHFINHIAYDIPSFSKRILWDVYSPDEIYKTYFHDMIQLIQSNCFDGLAHPDTIKMFHIEPSFDKEPYWKEIAKQLVKHHLYTEQNVGCHYRYHHEDIGLHTSVLSIFKQAGVTILTASDAHIPTDVGRYIEAATTLLKNA